MADGSWEGELRQWAPLTGLALGPSPKQWHSFSREIWQALGLG